MSTYQDKKSLQIGCHQNVNCGIKNDHRIMNSIRSITYDSKIFLQIKKLYTHLSFLFTVQVHILSHNN